MEITDSQMLDWLQSKLTPADSYCEVFFAGLRSGHNDASAFQIESNPEVFETINAPTIWEVIKKTMQTEFKTLLSSKGRDGKVEAVGEYLTCGCNPNKESCVRCRPID